MLRIQNISTKNTFQLTSSYQEFRYKHRETFLAISVFSNSQQLLEFVESAKTTLLIEECVER